MLTMPKQRYEGSDEFPILAEVRGVRVYKNPSNEIFIENIESGVVMRLSASRGGLEFTTFNCGGASCKPIVVANSIGWRVSQD